MQINNKTKFTKNMDTPKSVNPRNGTTHGLKSYDKADYEEHLQDALTARADVTQGVYPQWFIDKYYPYVGAAPTDLPQHLKEEGLCISDPEGLADVVHMDNPLDLPLAQSAWVRSEGAKPRESIHAYTDFIEAVPAFNARVAKYQLKAINDAFDEKYKHMVARPEELLEKVTGVDGKKMTQYLEGSPSHPDHPQGHSSFSGASARAVIDHYTLTPAQQKEILDGAYLWGVFRVLAFVHLPLSIAGGLYIGGLGEFFNAETKSLIIK